MVIQKKKTMIQATILIKDKCNLIDWVEEILVRLKDKD